VDRHGVELEPHHTVGAKAGKQRLPGGALVGLAGSVTTGSYVVMGGQVGVAGHLKIGDQVKVAAQSGIMTDCEPKVDVGGSPAMPLNEGKRMLLSWYRVPDLIKQVKQLKREVEKLEAALEEKSQDG